MQVPADVPFKLGIDARVHFDKGGKVTELMIECLDFADMKAVMSIGRYDGTDDPALIREHFGTDPSWGVCVFNQYRTVVETGVRMPDGRLVQVKDYEAHDLVGWAAACGTKGPLSNEPCPFCLVRMTTTMYFLLHASVMLMFSALHEQFAERLAAAYEF
jgi:hypothetical protein